MYILNDICYAGEMQEGIKVTNVKPLKGGIMLVTFSTGEKRLFDITTLHGPAFAPLEDEEIFNNPVLFHGVITWNNGEIDIAPETVYRDSYAYEGTPIGQDNLEPMPAKPAIDFSKYGHRTERGQTVEKYMDEIRKNDRI